jgi:hypothetical protein
MLKNACRPIALLLLLLLGAVSAVGQDDGRASAPSDEQVERWLATLRAFEVPEPGPISSETARLKREILRAPLEQMPPEVRAGYAFCQIAIHYNDGNWEGVQALRERILNTETWPRADQDAEVLLRIAGYDSGSVFPAPGGRAVGQSEEVFRNISLAIWEHKYQNWDRYFSTLERIATETDPLSFGTAAAILRLAQEKAERGKLEEAEEWVGLLGIESAEELHGVPYYDRHGNYVTPDQLKLIDAEALQHMLQKAHDRIAALKERRAAEADAATTATAVPSPAQQATPAVEWGGNPFLPPEERAIPPVVPAAESPGGAGGRTRLWLLLGGVLAAAVVGGGLLVWWRRRGAAAG